MKQVIIHHANGTSKAALLEDGRLSEFYVEQTGEKERAGNLYKGRVVNVLPGMQSAFVDIGLEKNAFLYRDDLLPAHLEKQPADKPCIQELVRPGQELIVQVKKEPSGSKGARVTTHFTLPGRWIVYMPNADYTAVSRKIESNEEKLRLKQIGDELRSGGDGIILRTIAAGQPAESLGRDWERLHSVWEGVLQEASLQKAPCLLFQDLALVPRLARDLFTDGIDELVVDDEELAEQIGRMVKDTAPKLARCVRVYRGEIPVFYSFPVAEELEKAFRRKIWLNNGAYLVMDQTEALTVIDVNTGRYTGGENLEQTVFETNMEAAREIVRLLRLRDIGGIIVVDFIDMKDENHRQAVRRQMEESARADRTKTLMIGWTKLGLFELTRKKNRQALDGQFFDSCPYCGGSGKVHSKDHPLYGQ
ncbi:Rne/Rng family ribonuclease [Paenibacillus aurantius]|uniref:Rne/Rng family ribonuclease n=1 Tax=Paenibacillus aurantius TaxID=2918900 RepID=A0AA96LGV0_9BACL|nr:Rne/Rng family ribonuclease [Paenibacillus aurantius]WNQ12979.1 Rne/Rng family ribonuclease [Paenibacillus aurantius]